MMKRALLLVGLLATLVTLPLPAVALAASPYNQVAACSRGIANFLGFEAWDGCLKAKYNGATRLTELNDVWLIVIPLIDSAVKAAGYTAVGFIIWGGIKYLKSQGDPGDTNTARMIIHNAVLGLIICIISVAMVQFIAGGIR